jgi:hypothetical protein
MCKYKVVKTLIVRDRLDIVTRLELGKDSNEYSDSTNTRNFSTSWENISNRREDFTVEIVTNKKSFST